MIIQGFFTLYAPWGSKQARLPMRIQLGFYVAVHMPVGVT